MVTAKIRHAARCFLIWREGNAVNWECTYNDLARATRIPSATVRNICMKRGWKLRRQHVIGHEAASIARFQSVPEVSWRDKAFNEASADLCELLT